MLALSEQQFDVVRTAAPIQMRALAECPLLRRTGHSGMAGMT
jgi:hypothetical protein